MTALSSSDTSPRLLSGSFLAGSLNFNAVQSGNTVTLTFANGGAVGIDPGGSLVDGTFELTILASKVVGAGGNLDGDGNGAGGDNYSSPTIGLGSVFRLFDDSNGDRIVDQTDFIAFRNAFLVPRRFSISMATATSHRPILSSSATSSI